MSTTDGDGETCGSRCRGCWRSDVGLFLRRLFGLPSVVLVWFGFWNLLDNYFLFGETPFYKWKQVGYICSGLFVLALTGTMYSNAGLEAAQRLDLTSDHRSCLRLTWTFVRAAIALFASITFWVGTFNVIDLYVMADSPGYDVGCMAVGLAMLMLTRTIFALAGTLPLAQSARPVEGRRNWRHYLWHTLSAVIALFGSVIFWKGLWSLLEEHLFAESVWRAIGYIGTGSALFLASNTPAIDLDDSGGPGLPFSYRRGPGGASFAGASRKHAGNGSSSGGGGGSGADSATVLPPEITWSETIILYVRSVIGLIAAVLVWTGMEDIFDMYLGLDRSLVREICFTLVGLLLTALSGALLRSAGVITPLWMSVSATQGSAPANSDYGYARVRTDDMHDGEAPADADADGGEGLADDMAGAR